jgi:hypothetical protein
LLNWQLIRGQATRLTCIKVHQSFVEQGIDEAILAFYGRGNLKPVLSSDKFIANVRRKTETIQPYFKASQDRLPAITAIVLAVAQQMKVEAKSIYTSAPESRIREHTKMDGSAFKVRNGQAFGMTHISGMAQAQKNLDKARVNDKNLSKTKSILMRHLTP